MDDDKGKVIPQLSLQVAKLTAALAAGKIGDTLTRGELRAAIGMDFSDGQLRSARYRCLRTARLWWETIRGADAWKCCDGHEMLDVGERDLKRIHRASKRAARKLAVVDATGLDPGEKVKLNTLVAQHGTLAAFSSSNANRALAARNASAPVELSKLLEALK